MGPNFVYPLDAKLRHHFMPPNSYGFTPPVTPGGYTTQGGNFWTLITPEIWKVLHAV